LHLSTFGQSGISMYNSDFNRTENQFITVNCQFTCIKAFLKGKLANHKYLPVYLKKNGHVYFGWIELSFDTIAEKIILHRAALCTEAGQKIKAGL
jgi:hypothetical protein